MDGSFSSLSLIAADGNTINNFISEGFNPQYNFYINSMASTAVNNNFFNAIWLESVGGTSYPKNTNFYIRSGGQVYIKNIQRDYANYLFEVVGLNTLELTFDGIPFFNSVGPEYFNYSGVTTNNYLLIFRNVTPAFESILSNTASWTGGVVSDYIIYNKQGISTSSNTFTLDGFSGNTLKSKSTYPPLALNRSRAVSGLLFWGQSDPNANVSTSLSPPGMFMIATERTSGADVVNINSSTSTNGGQFYSVKSRGTNSIPLTVSNGDIIGGYGGKAYDGTTLLECGVLRFSVDGAPSAGAIPTRLRLYLRDSSSYREVFAIRASGQIEVLIAPATGDLTDFILTRTSTGALRQVASTDIIATGAQYQLGYYAASGSKISPLTLITASRALKSDANGLPVAFDTATEPSLAELTYVKGVTSAIQTQINSKISSASIVSGLYAANGDGILVTFTVTHGFTGTPTNVQVTMAGVDVMLRYFVNNITATTFDVTFETPPIVGTNNVTFYWTVK